MMLLADPFTKALRDARRGLLGWAVGVGAVALMYAAFYPSISKPAFAQALENYPESLKRAFNLQDITSPAGYLGSYVFGLLVPVLLVVFTVITGSRAIAGDEESGVLDLILAHPVSRTRLLLSRLGALAVEVVLICAVVYLLLVAIAGPAKLASIGAGHLAAASAQLALFGLVFATLATAVGAATGKRAAAVAVTAVVAVAGYFANNLAPQVAGLHWAQKLSPFYWYTAGQPLRHGLQLGWCALLLGVSALLTAAAVTALARRDLAT
ncbi:MAG: beta-exotoxin transport system permease protein [Micromonosporaceae bacterium]|jgi:ABC-2 type transport system permease protein